jgi:ubiquinone biosynthesis protein UbiJ
LREQAFKAVKITGDADLAQLLGRLAGQLRWEYEEDLARLVGDAPANFAVRQGKKLLSATRSAASDLLDNVVEYVSEEKKVLLNKRDFMVHKSELIELRESVDRMEKRIQLLEQKAR